MFERFQPSILLLIVAGLFGLSANADESKITVNLDYSLNLWHVSRAPLGVEGSVQYGITGPWSLGLNLGLYRISEPSSTADAIDQGLSFAFQVPYVHNFESDRLVFIPALFVEWQSPNVSYNGINIPILGKSTPYGISLGIEYRMPLNPTFYVLGGGDLDFYIQKRTWASSIDTPGTVGGRRGDGDSFIINLRLGAGADF